MPRPASFGDQPIHDLRRQDSDDDGQLVDRHQPAAQARRATSAMYIGDTFDAMPMATPPRIRQTTNHGNVDAQPVSTEETANRNAARISSCLRPNLSLSPPETIEPTRQPSSAQLFAQPLS